MCKLRFCIKLTDEQKECCNSLLHTEEDYCWLPDITVYFDNIVDYTFYSNHIIISLAEYGWQTHKVYLVHSPDPLTLDLTGLGKDNHEMRGNNNNDERNDDDDDEEIIVTYLGNGLKYPVT